MKYFQIEMGKDGWLKTPVVTSFHYEGYIAIYLNRELLVANKAKYLFENRVCASRADLLAISRIIPKAPELFYEKGLLDLPSKGAEEPADPSDEDESESPFEEPTLGNFLERLERRSGPQMTSGSAFFESGTSSSEGDQEAEGGSHQDKKRRTVPEEPTGESFDSAKPH